MKYLFLLSILALSASATYAQTAPKILIGHVEIRNHTSLGGGVVQTQSLNFTDLKTLGTWISKDKEGRRGYLYVDGAKQAKWEDKNLVASLGGKLFKVKRSQHWKSGETALVIDDINDDFAAALSQGNFYAPIDEQLNFQWQMMDNAKIRLIITGRGDGSLRLAPDNAQISFRLTRNGQPLEPRTPGATARTNQPANFESLSAGARWQRDYDLNRYADFAQPGRYQVEIDYQLPAQNGAPPPDNPNLTDVKFDDKFEFDLPKK